MGKSFVEGHRKVVSNVDWQLLAAMLLLCLVGLVVLYSAGFEQETQHSRAFDRQLGAMGLGFFGFFLVMIVDPAFWRRWSFVLYGIGCIGLVFLLFGGVSAKGAQRWVDLGGFRAQPSQFMKLVLILALARVFSGERTPRDGYTIKTLIVPAVIIAVPVGLIMIQPDLGTGLCLALVAGSMVLAAGVRLGTLIRLAILAVLLAVPAWQRLHDYQRKRVITFVSPESDPLGAGYHAMQSKIAVGSGAITGKGFLQGTQSQLRFLPEQTTDFIFSVLAEEWGFIGSSSVILLYTFLIVHVLGIASRCPDRFSSFVVFGIAALIFWQVVINIGMVIGVLPVVGITLPLLSYGGSSLVTIMAGLGLVAGARSRRFLFA